MNGNRSRFDPPGALTGKRPKSSRLSRSWRQTQPTQKAAEERPSPGRRPDFLTPPRVSVGSRESSLNDSDLHQDIIWDPTSPHTHGLKGGRQRDGVVNISEMVSRIAPERGRPLVLEPTLQQWIGDSATIPCTPDLHTPRRKSPRCDPVDDLLKLAKQFDLSMFGCDEVVPQSRSGSEVMLDLDNRDAKASIPPAAAWMCMSRSPPTEDHLDPDPDLDLLFDASTQHLSGGFSQAPPPQVDPTPGAIKVASGKSSPLKHSPTLAVPKATADTWTCDDDWDDDLLNDTLLIEMTQNPHKFTDPSRCSTQKPPRDADPHAGTRPTPSGKVDKENVRQTTTLELESNPEFSTAPTSRCPEEFTTQHYRKTSHLKTEQVEQPVGKTTTVSDTPVLKMTQTFPKKPTANTLNDTKTAPASKGNCRMAQDFTNKLATNVVSQTNDNAARHFTHSPASASVGVAASHAPLLDDDLDSLFSSEPVWDDLADDELLSAMCEDLENQNHNANSIPAKHPPAIRHTPANSWDQQLANQQRRFPLKQVPGRPAGGAWAPLRASSLHVTTAKEPIRGCSTGVCGSSTIQTEVKGQFTFKKPKQPGSTRVAQCSEEEITLKRHQALERRRRLQEERRGTPPT